MSALRPWLLTTLATAALAAAVGAQPVMGFHHDPVPVPDTADLARARSPALALLTDRILQLSGGDLHAVHQHLLEAARGATDQATRYLLMLQAVEVAERAGNPAAACNALFHLESEFRIDRQQMIRDLLRRMTGVDVAPGVAAAVALTALSHAERAVHGEDERPTLYLYDIAMRASVASGDPFLHAFIRDSLPRLRSIHQAWRDHCVAAAGTERTAQELRLQQLALYPGSLGPVTLGELAPFLTRLPPSLAEVRACDHGPEGVLALADKAREDWLRRSLWLGAQQLSSERWRHAPDDAARGAIRYDLQAMTERLADQDGITRLRFRKKEDLDQLVFSNGNWRVEDGLLLGTSTGSDNFATHRLAFASIRSVIIKGGIRSEAGLNFRCKVGDVNLLLNWEVQPENHLWYLGNRTAAGPPALEPGKEHTIAMHATDCGVLVFIDDRHWWTAPGGLSGTVCVYPALGSEIFVREILVDGELATEGPVKGPRGQMM